MTMPLQLHASAAALDGQGVLILGEAGAGKSSLLIELMARGFDMIGDDQIMLREADGAVWLAPHPKAEGRFEYRGVGVFRAKRVVEARLKLVINLDYAPQARLPEGEIYETFGQKFPILRAKGLANLPSFLYLWISGKIE